MSYYFNNLKMFINSRNIVHNLLFIFFSLSRWQNHKGIFFVNYITTFISLKIIVLFWKNYTFIVFNFAKFIVIKYQICWKHFRIIELIFEIWCNFVYHNAHSVACFYSLDKWSSKPFKSLIFCYMADLNSDAGSIKLTKLSFIFEEYMRFPWWLKY